MNIRRIVGIAALLSIACCMTSSAAFSGFVGMTNGYFYDKATGKPVVPHGVAYQTWNRPLGVWQTPEQLRYDLDEMVKMGANSIRVDFVWQHIEEDADNVFKWTNYDLLVQECEKRDLRIFALIGYQWPPNWFPDAWYTMHPPERDSEGIEHTNRWQSDIIGYETPQARAQYAEWISNVCARFKNSKAIAGWVVGNESGYLGLWSGLLDGYDTNCEARFRTYCQTKFATIGAVNTRWGTTYTNFNQITFVDQYRAYGVEGAIWADMVQWREDSIGSFTALGAKAAKQADTNHLISYSTVGMQWGEEDWRYHAEDRAKITSYAIASNAPIDFFSVNNYPWSILGHESQNGHWGVSFTKKVAKVPVLYSETGFTSSETMWPGMNVDRQGPLIRNALWESLEVGAIGTHIFSWMDRPYITDREKGFGIVYADRGIKPAYWVSRNAFQLMEQAKIGDLLMNSKDPTPDIAFLWTDAADSQYNRYECEMQQIAGALERIGYEPTFINLAELGARAYTNYKAIILPRNMRVEDVVPNSTNKTVLDFLRQDVIGKGVHVVASADVPGMQNFNGKPRSQFVTEVRNLFGVDPTDMGGFEAPQRRRHYVSSYWGPITVRFTTNAVGALAGNYTYRPIVWKYNDEVTLVTGGIVWATMDSGRNKGFEASSNITVWSSWTNVGSTAAVRRSTGWQYSGSNVLELSGRDAGVWQDFPAVPFGRYTASTYLRSATNNALRAGTVAYLAIEWYGETNRFLGVSESPILSGATPGSGWVKYAVDAIAPSNTHSGRRIIRVQPVNMALNGALTGSGAQPTSWTNWNDVNHDADSGTYLGTNGNSWAFWQDGGLYQDISTGFATNETLQFGGWLQTPSWDALRGGTKQGVIQLELYNGATLVSTVSAGPVVDQTTTNNVWIESKANAVIPAGVNRVRVLVRCNNPASGSGRFYADSLFVRNASRGAGSVFADNIASNPAVVVKNHGTAKSAIFLYSVGDNSPDTGDDPDLEPDLQPWKYRYDVLSSLFRTYLGIVPKISVTGTNAYLCLPEYRVTSNNNYVIQLKNYSYNTNLANGGPALTFNVASPMLTGKTIRAYEQGKIIEQNSDGNFPVTLVADGHEMLYAYTPVGGTAAVNQVVQISDAPSIVHPFGDKVYTLKVKYDCLTRTDLRVRIAFQENGNNGDAVANEIYQVLTNKVSGVGEQWFFMWIPDANQGDTDYKSTPDGGKYHFNAWLETTTGVAVAQAVPVPTILEWGVRPTNVLASTVTKGQSVTMNLEWEELYESLAWKNTPAARNEAYPGRVAVYRSLKTEAQFPGHLAKANQVCDWLNTLGYTNANPLDIGFDNVLVTGLFTNNFNNGVVSSWTRAAGAFNWGASAATNGYLRAWRIGNDDNILTAGTSTWGAVTVSADVRYNKQDPYYSDIELFPKYVDRNNYYKIGIRNFFGFWRIKFLVRVNGVIQQQGWLYEFGKTNRPVENTWYNLKVAQGGATNAVYFNNTLVGKFYATNFPTGKIALGTKAVQLGIWEPQKGYFFIDDDENGYSADPNTNGAPLNLDWGYLNQFYRTLVLPGVYVMNDKEASNMVTWAKLGLNSIIATDGSVAMRNETGASDLGRVESLFGVSAAVGTISGVSKVVIGTNDHYVTLDYAPNATVTASGAGKPYTTLTRALSLAAVSNAGAVAKGLIANVITNNPGAPGKTMVFNFDVDTSGQLTNGLKKLAQRAFEWSRNDAYKVRIELKYINPANNPSLDLLVYVTNAWILAGTGVSNVVVNVPSDGIMTGDGKFYWAIYTYPWDATNGWTEHNGFYSSGNDTTPKISIAGKGLQIFGVTDKAFAGRDWDTWVGYNTRTTTVSVAYGIKEKGVLQAEDNFNDGNYTGWNITASPRIAWSVVGGSLQAQATNVTTGGYGYIYWNGLAITGKNITIEYDTTFTNGARDGGIIYRGTVLYVNPNLCGWADSAPNYFATNRPVTGKWHRVVVHIRDGSPYLMSDLFVDGKTVFLSEPIQSAAWTTNTIGFLSPYSNLNSIVRWDNVRVADEQYSVSYTNFFGEKVPTNATTPTLWSGVPDYDPAQWENDGTTLGTPYEWYVYFHGEGVHSYANAKVYFAPRLRVELASFPTNLYAGTNIVVPVEWENLPTNSAKLRTRLFDAYSGTIYVEKTNNIAGFSGNTNVAVTVPSMPAGTNYVWSSFIYLNSSTNPWVDRLGSDDTFRFDDKGIGVEPETMIRMQAPPATGGVINLYSDAGTLAGSSILVWNGAAATFNGNYTGITPPEGTMSFQTTGALWQGWGVFKTNNMSAYSAGYIKFWVRSAIQLKMDVESPGVKRTTYIPSTTNNWLAKSIPVSTFSGVVLSNMYGLFEITAESATTFYVDDVKWSLTP